MFGSFYNKNGVTTSAGLNAQGIYVYRVEHKASGHWAETTMSSEAHRIAVAWGNQAPLAAAIMESPLPAAERSTSGLAAGAILTMPTDAQAERMRVAVKWSSAQLGRPVVIQRWRGCNLRMLKAMARRGWIKLDHEVRPTCGTMTDAGRHALARWEAAR